MTVLCEIKYVSSCHGDITVVHDFVTREEAQAFVNSAELKAARSDAGVEGEPDIWFTERV